ncbi:hypothetical protein [Flavitalea sp.]|nr:hypothetical protein [Flavitalea sp.]
MMRFFLLFILSFFIVFAQGQQSADSDSGLQNSSLAKMGFPQNFIGDWQGKLQWMVAGKPVQEFLMRLIARPADTSGQYTWQIIYGDQGKDNRPYLLKPVDTAKGHWTVDERDGIILDSYVHGNSLHGAFTNINR